MTAVWQYLNKGVGTTKAYKEVFKLIFNIIMLKFILTWELEFQDV